MDGEKHKARCRAYYAAHKAEINNLQKKRRLEDPEKRKVHDAAYRARNKEKVRAAQERYELANPERVAEAKRKWREENPEKLRAAQLRWDKNNPEKKRVHRENRRARERNAVGQISSGIVERLLSEQEGKCRVCAAGLVSLNFELDHIMPLILGGSNEDSNLQLLCRPCNRIKGRKHPEQFMRERVQRQ